MPPIFPGSSAQYRQNMRKEYMHIQFCQLACALNNTSSCKETCLTINNLVQPKFMMIEVEVLLKN